jgi:hypothetical protein
MPSERRCAARRRQERDHHGCWIGEIGQNLKDTKRVTDVPVRITVAGSAGISDRALWEQPDHIVVVGLIIEPREPRRIRRARIAERCEGNERSDEHKSQRTTAARTAVDTAGLLDNPNGDGRYLPSAGQNCGRRNSDDGRS